MALWWLQLSRLTLGHVPIISGAMMPIHCAPSLMMMGVFSVCLSVIQVWHCASHLAFELALCHVDIDWYRKTAAETSLGKAGSAFLVPLKKPTATPSAPAPVFFSLPAKYVRDATLSSRSKKKISTGPPLLLLAGISTSAPSLHRALGPIYAHHSFIVITTDPVDTHPNPRLRPPKTFQLAPDHYLRRLVPSAFVDHHHRAVSPSSLPLSPAAVP